MDIFSNIPLDEHPAYYSKYFALIPQADILSVLEHQITHRHDFLKLLTRDKEDHKYQPEKWTVKEVLIHIVDTERIFGYRILSIARGETNNLMGFDENQYTLQANANQRNLSSILEEWNHLRKSHISLFNTFNEEQFLRKGSANGNIVSVRALIKMMACHESHHLNVLKERYF